MLCQKVVGNLENEWTQLSWDRVFPHTQETLSFSFLPFPLL